MDKSYCESIYQTTRRKTRVVMCGNVGIGGDNPIRIQSMTTSNTRDIEATIEQIVKLEDCGCEIVRVTVQGMKEADACEGIKDGLLKRGINIPLVADIHFFPPAAVRAVDFVDKVRINPGNFADKRASFKQIEYDDESYAKELLKIEDKFAPLVLKCRQLKKAMRIGTNHGSLSDRIMNRFGDTPLGMVKSALEFADICRKYDYHDFVFSMKASNPQVMILAYRLLAAEMLLLGWDYPLHLGVTEAGEGEDGRIKSAMGIGALLLDGLGDTIRVSLTEDAWNEIDPCKRLITLANEYGGRGVLPFTEQYRQFEALKRRKVTMPGLLSMHRDGTVIISPTVLELTATDAYEKLGYDEKDGALKLTRSSADVIVMNEKIQDPVVIGILKRLGDIGISSLSPYASEGCSFPIYTLTQAKEMKDREQRKARFALVGAAKEPLILSITDEDDVSWGDILNLQPSLILLSPTQSRLHSCRKFFEWLQQQKLQVPVILHFKYACSKEDIVIQAAAEMGALLCDGYGEGVWIDAPYDVSFLRNLSFSILQSARLRTSKTEFISCPSCGRTLFDLQNVSKRIRSRTAHLPGVKIAIMGCIVNGPGEMADADFGYVGSKPGMIDLYVGKNCVEKDISFADADDRLVALIKAHGRWVESMN